MWFTPLLIISDNTVSLQSNIFPSKNKSNQKTHSNQDDDRWVQVRYVLPYIIFYFAQILIITQNSCLFMILSSVLAVLLSIITMLAASNDFCNNKHLCRKGPHVCCDSKGVIWHNYLVLSTYNWIHEFQNVLVCIMLSQSWTCTHDTETSRINIGYIEWISTKNCIWKFSGTCSG